MKFIQPHPQLNRRESLQRMGIGLGTLGLAGILAQDAAQGAHPQGVPGPSLTVVVVDKGFARPQPSTNLSRSKANVIG